jgi:hypothetical protein
MLLTGNPLGHPQAQQKDLKLFVGAELDAERQNVILGILRRPQFQVIDDIPCGAEEHFVFRATSGTENPASSLAQISIWAFT